MLINCATGEFGDYHVNPDMIVSAWEASAHFDGKPPYDYYVLLVTGTQLHVTPAGYEAALSCIRARDKKEPLESLRGHCEWRF